jgi:hypothetical protein
MVTASSPVFSRPRLSGRAAILAWAAVLLAAFAYRLAFGLCAEFLFEDETQIFLIGLRYYAGAWPHFGADVVWTQSQIPGALQGLLVGFPFHVVSAPEAPYVLLSLLSFAGIALLAWYVGRRLPEVPRWLVWGWLLFIPWTLQYGLHITNPSHVLAFAIVFFVGFFEAHERFTLRVLSAPVAFFMMGAAVFAILQLHMSWPLLGPFVLVALWSRRRLGARALAVSLAGLVAGSLVTGSLLVPTFLHFGLAGGGGGTHRNFTFKPVGPLIVLTTLARFFSFASMELPRFLGLGTAQRLELLLARPWMIPFAAILLIAGVLQPLAMAWLWFRRRDARAEWRALCHLVAGAVLLIYFSYWFVIEPPQAHAFYLLAPLAFVYAFYGWTLVDSRRLRVVAAVVLGASVVYHAGFAVANAPEHSLYKYRGVVAAAVTSRVPEVFGHRRFFAVEGLTRPTPGVMFGHGNPLNDLKLVSADWWRGPADMLLGRLTIRNDSRTTAYRDVHYDVTYRDAAGKVLDARYDVLAEFLQPGETITATHINQGFVAPYHRLEVRILRAEPLLPLTAVRH